MSNVLTMFHQDTRQLFYGKRGEKSTFGHSFGGSADYVGLVFQEGQPPVHLLFRLNLADPAVGLSLPDIRWLPLLCAIRYGGCNLGYRVISDEEVKILHQEETKPWDDFPYAGFPEKLPVKPVAFEEKKYDPGNPREVHHYAAIFGYDALSPKQFAKLVRYVVDKGIYNPEIMLDVFGCSSPEEYLLKGNSLPFVQGPPVDDCPDSSCSNHGRPSSLRTIAIFQEERKEARNLWGPNCGSLQIIYQACPQCGAIRTTNQCT